MDEGARPSSGADTLPASTSTVASAFSGHSSASRWQKAARQISYIRRATGREYHWTRGDEPGVDVATASFAARPVRCTIVDSSADSVSILDLSNDELIAELDKPRPEWAALRWIACYGVSWDVLRALSLKHNLHPLAVEDVLSVGGAAQSRSKSDYYKVGEEP